jgi:hypothetical protein
MNCEAPARVPRPRAVSVHKLGCASSTTVSELPSVTAKGVLWLAVGPVCDPVTRIARRPPGWTGGRPHDARASQGCWTLLESAPAERAWLMFRNVGPRHIVVGRRTSVVIDARE